MENIDNSLAVSVVIPVYNASKYIRDCIDSVLRQNGVAFEVIIVDDGSADGSSDICDNLSELDDKVKVYHIKNSGVTFARKLGVEKSNGEYICFVDADDQLTDGALLSMYGKVKEDNVDILATAKMRVTSKGNMLLKNKKEGFMDKQQYAACLLDGSCFYGPHGRLTRRELFSKSKALDIPREIELNEDLIMNLLLGADAHKILVTNNIDSYKYFERTDSVTKKNPKINQYKYWEKTSEFIKGIMESGYTLSQNSQLQRAYLLMKLQRFSIVDWNKVENKAREKAVKEFSRIRNLNREELKCLYFIKYPRMHFFIKVAFKLLSIA